MHYFSKNDILLYQINNINKIILSFFYFIVFFSYLYYPPDLAYSIYNYGSDQSCRWALFTTWGSEFKLHLIFHIVELKKNILIFYLADFHSRNWCIQGFHEKRFYNLHLSLFSYYFSLEMRLVRSKSKITK